MKKTSPKTSPASDEALMLAYQQGDMAAFEKIYMRYEHKVYSYLYHRLGDREVCQDLFQDIFLRVHRARHDFDPQRPFATWLFTIANNALKNELKRLGRLKAKFAHGLPEPVVESENGGVRYEAGAKLSEASRRIGRALQKLPDTQREVILLNKFFGFSYAEIAEMTGSTEAAVKQKAYRGYTALRGLLGSLSHDCASANTSDRQNTGHPSILPSKKAEPLR